MSDDGVKIESNLAHGPQPVESKILCAIKKQPKRLKVRHLSELTKRIIVDRYAAIQDFDEVAVAMELPGLTGKTVANVIAAHILPGRRPPAFAPIAMRRAA